MKHKYELVKYGGKEPLATKEEAIQYAEGELTRQMQEKIGKNLLSNPKVIDGGREKYLYLQMEVKDTYND